MKEKIFIGKWLISIFIGLVAIVIGIVGFVINYMEMGIFFLLVGTAIVFWFVAFVPHSFVFDNEKILMVCFFKSKTVKYVYIKSCDKEESGIRTYPWGTYYRIIADKPFWQEFNIPSTKEIDVQIKRHIKG